MLSEQTRGTGISLRINGRKVEANRKLSRDLFMNDRWPLAIRSLASLLEEFKSAPDWHDPKNSDILQKVIESGKRFDESRKK